MASKQCMPWLCLSIKVQKSFTSQYRWTWWTLLPERLFSCRFLHFHAKFSVRFCHPGGTGRPKEGSPASAPSFPSLPGGWERQGRLRGAERTHLEGPLDASTASARQSPLRSRAQSAAGPVPRSPTLSGAAAAAAAAAAGRGDQQPEGRLEILVREREVWACWLCIASK